MYLWLCLSVVAYFKEAQRNTNVKGSNVWMAGSHHFNVLVMYEYGWSYSWAGV